MPVKWDPDFNVGHSNIDAQHEHIHALIGALADARAGEGATNADVLLEHIARFLEWHFATEEDVMQKGAYPLLEEHRVQHIRCLEAVAKFRDDSRRTGRVDVQAVEAYLSEWLRQHTLRSDRLYMLYVHPRAEAGDGEPCEEKA